MSYMMQVISDLTTELEQSWKQSGDAQMVDVSCQSEIGQPELADVKYLNGQLLHKTRALEIAQTQLENTTAMLVQEKAKNNELFQTNRNLKGAMETFEKCRQEALIKMDIKLSKSNCQLKDLLEKHEKAEAMIEDLKNV